MPRPECKLDHIVIAAPNLASGAAHVRDALGAQAQTGGQHPRMGTHNQLLRLGERCYLEIIAVDPGAPSPSRPRWFDMDAIAPTMPARLVTWVARTHDIAAATAASPEPLGEILPMTRGSWAWHITVPADGSLRGGGTVPTLIQWQSSAHPATTMQDFGLALEVLTLYHPEPARLEALLQALGMEGPISVRAAAAGEAARVEASIRTPHGLRTLR